MELQVMEQVTPIPPTRRERLMWFIKNYDFKKDLKILAVCCLCWFPGLVVAIYLHISSAWLFFPWFGGMAYTIYVGWKNVKIEDIEYYEYDCGSPCTENGCMGHETDIPVAFTINGIRVEIDGYWGGDFPGDDKEAIKQVKAFVKEFAKK